MSDEAIYDPDAFHDFEHANWEEAAPFYHDNLGRTTSQVARPVLDAVGAAEAVRLLDVACGPGWLAAAAAQRGARAMGFDFSPNMIEDAKKRHPGVDFREGDAEALPFGDAAFEAVVCSFGLHHFPNPDRALGEAYRVLAPGGRYAFTSWCAAERSPFVAIFRGAVAAHGNPNPGLPIAPPQYHFDDPEACRAILQDAGFQECSVSEIPVVVRVDRPELTLQASFNGGGRARALLLAQTEEARARITEAVAEEARKYEKDGKIEIPRPALLVYGKKPMTEGAP